jgi:tRNA dimethylallyltransferase
MKAPQNKLLVYILGPTAIGKTALSIDLAKKFKTEILSADSRQLYRQMEIGTAKPSPIELSEVRHHFINALSVEEAFNVNDFEKLALDKIDEVFKFKDVAFMTGGSGLFLHAIWHGFDESIPGQDKKLREALQKGFEKEGLDYLTARLSLLDPEALSSIDTKNPVRLMRSIEISSQSDKSIAQLKSGAIKNRPFRQLKIGLTMDRKELYARINQRVHDMIANGLVDEVRSLEKYRHHNALRTVGYQEIFRYFDGEYSLEDAIEKIKTNSRRYAKRQMTWFRRYDDINWFDTAEQDKIEELIKEKLNNQHEEIN